MHAFIPHMLLRSPVCWLSAPGTGIASSTRALLCKCQALPPSTRPPSLPPSGMTGVCCYAQLLLVERGSCCLPGLASNHDPPNLCLPTSWDSRCEPHHAGLCQALSNALFPTSLPISDEGSSTLPVAQVTELRSSDFLTPHPSPYEFPVAALTNSFKFSGFRQCKLSGHGGEFL
jgi:hypothetical protein